MPRSLPFILVLALVMVAGCARDGQFIFDRHTADKVQTRTYKATDMLAGQALDVVNTNTPIAVGTLSDVNAIESSSALGRIIAEQIGTRFVQLGYNVSEIKLRDDINVQRQLADNDAAAGEYMLSRDRTALAGLTNARAIVTGTYAQAGNSVLVNLRMIDTQTSKVLAAYDYMLPLTSDIRALMGPASDEGNIFSNGYAY